MPTNDFKAFATGGGANVITQSAFNALTTLIANGFSAGVAKSNELNKVWRQSSVMAYVLGQFVVDLTGLDALDDGNTATLLARFKNAITIGGGSGRVASAAGTANDITADFNPNISSLTDGLMVLVQAASANTGAATFNPDGIGAKSIYKGTNVALVSGDIPGANAWMILIYDQSLDKWCLVNPARGSSEVIGSLVGFGKSDYTSYFDLTTDSWIDVTGFDHDIVVTKAPVNVEIFSRVQAFFSSAGRVAYCRLLINGGEHANVVVDRANLDGIGSPYSINNSFHLSNVVALAQNTTYTVKVQMKNSSAAAGQNVRVNANSDNPTSADPEAISFIRHLMYKA